MLINNDSHLVGNFDVYLNEKKTSSPISFLRYCNDIENLECLIIPNKNHSINL